MTADTLFVESKAVEEIYLQLGQRIRARRDSLAPKRMSQQDLAARVGLTRVSIANIELGRQRVQVHMLYEIARVLDVHPRDLLPEPLIAAPLPRGLVERLKPSERTAVERLVGQKGKPNEA